jgi:hypothetical protein
MQPEMEDRTPGSQLDLGAATLRKTPSEKRENVAG